MQVGSLVVYTFPLPYIDMITPEKEVVYTVRYVGNAQSVQRPEIHQGIRLEEIVNECAPNGKEFVYVGAHFKEVQEPMSLAILLEECQTKLV